MAPKPTLRLPEWTPLEPAELPPMTEEQIRSVMRGFNLSRERAIEQLDEIKQDTCFINSRYQVNVRKYTQPPGCPCDMIHLSIKRRDKDRVGPEKYRDFMRIKRELLGPNIEGCEVYPAEEREVDTANQYHLWCFADPTVRLPFGYNEGRHMFGESTSTTRQHPFEENADV